MDIPKYNRWAWDQQVDKGNRWTLPASSDMIAKARDGDWQIVLTPTRTVPHDWLDPLPGKKVLCLAGGGGQQAPILAAAGADVTTLDNSPRQLEQDRLVADREGLRIETCLGEMNDLSRFAEDTFDAIVHPCSNGFVQEVRRVWREAYRVLRPGGTLISGFSNPLLFIFDYEALEQGELRVAHCIPYSDTESLDERQRQQLREQGEPFVFGHSMDDQIGGQIDAGFILDGFFEDRVGEGPYALLSRFIPIYVATRASKS